MSWDWSIEWGESDISRSLGKENWLLAQKIVSIAAKKAYDHIKQYQDKFISDINKKRELELKELEQALIEANCNDYPAFKVIGEEYNIVDYGIIETVWQGILWGRVRFLRWMLQANENLDWDSTPIKYINAYDRGHYCCKKILELLEEAKNRQDTIRAKRMDTNPWESEEDFVQWFCVPQTSWDVRAYRDFMINENFSEESVETLVKIIEYESTLPQS